MNGVRVSVWIWIKPDIFSGLIEVRTVCKGCQHTTNDVTGRLRVCYLENNPLNGLKLRGIQRVLCLSGSVRLFCVLEQGTLSSA